MEESDKELKNKERDKKNKDKSKEGGRRKQRRIRCSGENQGGRSEEKKKQE